MALSSTSRGLRLIKAMEQYTKTRPSQFDTNIILKKMKLLSASEGVMRSSFTVDPAMCNSLDTLHGGYISSVIDTMTMFAQMSNTDGKLAWTTSLHIDFLKPAYKGDTITVETSPLKVGGNPVMEALLRNEKTGDIVAKGVVSLLPGADKLQRLAKDVLNFDVYEK